MQEYKAVTSPPVYISSLDLGPKYVDKLGTGFQEYRKTYGQNYCLGQLIFWHNQQNTDPDCSLAKASMGCISLPEMGSFYARVQKPSRQRVYGPKTVKFMLSRMVRVYFGSVINAIGFVVLIHYFDFPSGEAAAETMAKGSDMVIQELSQSDWQPNAGRGVEQLTPREGFGTLAKAQNAHISGHVG